MQSALYAAENRLLDDRFELVRVLGRGTTGVVYHARDLDLDGLDVALKVLHPHLAHDRRVEERFRRELRIGRSFAHPQIVRVYELARLESGELFFSLELVRGGSLGSQLARRDGRGIPWRELGPYLADLADALQHLHDNGVIHCDLKPENVLCDEDGRIKLSDFSISRFAADRAKTTGANELIGTPFYSSPELLTGDAFDHRTDIYSFGILAFELATGARPFASERFLDLTHEHLERPLPSARTRSPDVPDWADEFFRSAAAKEPANRPVSLRPFIERMKEAGYLRPPVRRARSTPAEPLLRRRAVRRIVRRALAGLLTLTVVALGVAAGFSGNDSVQVAVGRIAIALERRVGPPWVAPLKWYAGLPSGTDYENQLWSMILEPYPLWNETLLHTYVEAGVPLNNREPGGDTVLLALARRGYSAESIATVIEAGGDPTAMDRHGSSIIHHMLRLHYQEQRIDPVLRLLMRRGQLPMEADKSRLTPLALAIATARTRSAELLLQGGADPNRPIAGALTPLSLALAMDGKLRRRLVEILLAAPTIDLRAADDPQRGDTALSLALYSGADDEARLILCRELSAPASRSMPRRHRIEALHAAIRSNRPAVALGIVRWIESDDSVQLSEILSAEALAKLRSYSNTVELDCGGTPR